jgi:hypothetical protein
MTLELTFLAATVLLIGLLILLYPLYLKPGKISKLILAFYFTLDAYLEWRIVQILNLKPPNNYVLYFTGSGYLTACLIYAKTICEFCSSLKKKYWDTSEDA